MARLLVQLAVVVCVLASSQALPTAVGRQQRIFGGYEAKVGQFPYMASLRVYAYQKWRHTCGGSIVTERWILTAGHCLVGYKEDKLRVYLGTTTDSGDGDVYQAEKLFVHEDYSIRPIRDDIGLLKTTQQIAFTNVVQPIRISYNFVPGSVTAVASGWGYYTAEINVSSPSLQYLQQITLEAEECKKKLNNTVNLNEKSLCAYNSLGIGMCNGDSGSPLVADGKQIGIASFVRQPCASGHPDVYVRPTSYLNWISLIVHSN